VFEDQELSYSALNAAANKLAHRLIAQGVTTGTPVGLATSRGPDLLIGALGILKAGGAYVPLDPAYPADRIKHYIADSGAPVIVTESALADSLPRGDAALLVLDTDADLAGAPDTNPDAGATADTLAYLIYTSGSTGTPKGVMVGHGNVANFFAGMDQRIRHKDGDAWLAVTSLSFDISVLELFWTLSRGFKLVLAGDDSRTELSRGPIAVSDRKIDFNLFYWGNDDGIGPEKYRLAGRREVRRRQRLQRSLDARAALPRLWGPVPEPVGDGGGCCGCDVQSGRACRLLRGTLAPSRAHRRGMGRDRQPHKRACGACDCQRLAA